VSSRQVNVLPPGVIYRRLLKMCAPFWVMFVLASLAMALYAATDTGFAFVMNNFIKSLDPANPVTEQNWIQRWLPLVILLLFAGRGLAAFSSAYCLGWIGRHVIKDMRTSLFAKFLTLPARFFDVSSDAELLSKLTYNIEQVAEATSNVVTILIRDTLTIIGLVAYMVYLSPPLSAFLLVVVPLISILIRYLSKLFRRHSVRIQDSMGDVTRITSEALQSHRVVKIFGGQEYEADRFNRVNETNRRMNMRLITTRAGGDALTALVLAIGVAGVVYFASLESIRPADLGDIVGFITAMVFVMRPLRQLTNMNVSLQRGIAAGGSVFQLLDEPVEPDVGTYAPDRVSGRVEFRQVEFSYSDEKGGVLHDINLIVPAGEALAIVGRSGSGKSTLVSLLPRFYDVTAGKIMIDDRPLRDYSLVGLRNQISLVSQEVVLFNDSIANNIAYGGLVGVSREKIEVAAQAAHVQEFTNDLPDGLDTQVGERGVLLSGGQRQRIAIARALLKDAPVLILDEATSALDTESERHIQHALELLMENRTTFVIAHRLSTVENADRIIVMESGRIVEVGTHDELLAKEGHYRTLHRLQFRDESL
jgi:subfamily B ATP-binding cassette protein MsbA